MANDDEELRRHKERLAARQTELSAAKDRFRTPNAKDVEEQLRAETISTEQLRNATPEQQANWHHQENDPRHVFPNSFVAAEQNQTHAQLTNLSQQQLPHLSDEELHELRAEFGERIDKAQKDLNLLQEQRFSQQQEQNVTPQR